MNQRHSGPSWLTAVLIFAVLLGMLRLFGTPSSTAPNGLAEQFAAAPPAPDAGVIELPPVPTNLANLARTASARVISGLTSRPIDQTGRNAVLAVTINQLEPTDAGLHIGGTVTNISAEPFDVSLDYFKFTDGNGTVYASSGSPKTTLQPQQNVPLDITLPQANATRLTLAVLVPANEPINLVLLANVPQ